MRKEKTIRYMMSIAQANDFINALQKMIGNGDTVMDNIISEMVNMFLEIHHIDENYDEASNILFGLTSDTNMNNAYKKIVKYFNTNNALN